jgi:hypothetical protein
MNQRLPVPGLTLRRRCAAALAACALLGLAACAPTRFEAASDVPPPLVVRLPVVMGVHLPQSFREQVHEEKEGDDVRLAVDLGKAQSAGFMRIMNALFERVVPVASPEAGAATDRAIRGVLVPALEDVAIVTPYDAGLPTYAVSLRYRISLYDPQGRLQESWTFTGYGAQPASAFPGRGDEALQAATRLAMRDAAARMAVEFREEVAARGLVPGSVPAPAEVQPPGE